MIRRPLVPARSVAELALEREFVPQAVLGPPPAPPAELDELRIFEGYWSAEGVQFDTPLGPGHPQRCTWVGERDLDGFVIACRFESIPTPQDPMPGKGLYQLAYDLARRQFAAVWTDNWGCWEIETSPGWKGDTIVFFGEYGGLPWPLQSYDTFTRRSEREMDYRCDIVVHGQRLPFMHHTFRR